MTAATDLPVGVIGAGGSGLVAAAALRRAGVEMEVLEARDGVGGTWRYDPDGDGSACYASLMTNTSRRRTSLAQAQIPGRPWEYVPHREMLAWLEGLVDREGLRDHVRVGWRVARAVPDGSSWVVTSDAGQERRYRALVCALGVNGRPRMAALPGRFTGEQLHSAGYREPAAFAGRDVLVIGLGTSGCEVAGELAGAARTVHVAVRTPMWTMTRRIAGFPIDWLDNPWIARTVPWSVRRRMLAIDVPDHDRAPVPARIAETERRCGDDVIAISDSLPKAARRGLVTFHPDVQAVDDRTVTFADGVTTDVDVIVHATGFDLPTGFLPPELRPGADGLYRGIAHPDCDGLHFVGLIEAHRALLPIAETQAAWMAAVLSGRLVLPGVRRATAKRRAGRGAAQSATSATDVISSSTTRATWRRCDGTRVRRRPRF